MEFLFEITSKVLTRNMEGNLMYTLHGNMTVTGNEQPFQVGLPVDETTFASRNTGDLLHFPLIGIETTEERGMSSDYPLGTSRLDNEIERHKSSS